MSDSITIPPLVSSTGTLTTAGEDLAAFITREIRDKRDTLESDSGGLSDLRLFYALVVKTPPRLTVEQFFGTFPRQTDYLWVSYISSLDPIPAQRAQVPAMPQESTINESKSQTVLLTESTKETTAMQPLKLTHSAMNLTRDGMVLVRYLTYRLRSKDGLEASGNQLTALESYVNMVERGGIGAAAFLYCFPDQARDLAALVDADATLTESDLAAAALGNALAQLK